MTSRRVLIALVILLIPAAIHAIWDQVESTLFAREVARIAARHEPVSTVFQRFRLPTAEQHEAARIYAAAANLAASKYRDPRPGNRDDQVEAAFASGHAAVGLENLRREYVEGEPALDLLNLASRLDFAGFGPIAPELYENASSLQALNGVNCLRADILTARGDAKGAAGALIQSVRLQRTISREFYRGIAARRLFGSLRLLLRYAPPDPDTLLALQRGFEELPDEDDVAEQLEMERARLLGDFWPYPPDRPTWALRPLMSTRGVADTVGFVALRPLLTHAARGQFKPFEDAIAAAREPWPQKLDSRLALMSRYRLNPDGSRTRTLLLDRAVALMPPALGILNLNYYLPAAGMNLAIRRTSITALATERYRRAHDGDAPGSLDALVPDYLAAVPQDPFSGQPLRYRRTADSYIVYSVDVNRIDDGGVLYGFGSGSTARMRRADDPSPRDIGIRVPLASVTNDKTQH